jgi:uncharacterized protein related to proFAR isomerase
LVPFEIDGKNFTMDVSDTDLFRKAMSDRDEVSLLQARIEDAPDSQEIVKMLETVKTVYVSMIDRAFGAGSYELIFGPGFPVESVVEVYQAICEQLLKYNDKTFVPQDKR